MAFILEDGTGLDNANSLASVDEFKEYYTDRNIDITALADTDIEALLIQGTDYITQKYYNNFIGELVNENQSLLFPRKINDTIVFPARVKYATIVLAYKSNTAELFEDTRQAVKKEKVEGLEVEYQDDSIATATYNTVDGYLKPYINGFSGAMQVSRS